MSEVAVEVDVPLVVVRLFLVVCDELRPLLDGRGIDAAGQQVDHPGSEYRRLPDIDAGEVRIHAERRSAIERRCQRLIEPAVTRLDRRLLVAQGVPRDAQARREAEL